MRRAGGVKLIHTFVRQINSGKERKWVYVIWNSLAFGPKSLSGIAGPVQVCRPTCNLDAILAMWRKVEW